jgi:kynureninase
VNRADCLDLDRQDPLAPIREQFLLPEDIIFMGGNSLGALSSPVVAGVDRLVREEWGKGLLRSWNEAGWIDAPHRIGNKIGQLLGALPGEIVVADSTSVDLYKLLISALRHQQPDRQVILTEAANFPTDLYVAQGIVDLLGPPTELKMVPRTEVLSYLDDRTAVVMLTHVDYGSGDVFDMADVTRRVHAGGALVLWDLSHSAGAMPVNLHGCDVDLAVGCGYKYLNGGPGAPAYLYVAQPLQDAFLSPIWGWMGHADPFAFRGEYQPHQGIGRFLAGTPPMIALAGLEASIDLWLTVGQEAVWRKSRELSELMIELVDQRCRGYGVTIASPRDPDRRGSHLALRHPAAYAIKRALTDRGVIGDFRPPDVMRFSLTPLYLRYVDVWDTVDCLVDILTGRNYLAAEYAVRETVT